MTPMQQMLLGVGAKDKIYIDDVFSTYLYTGNSGANQIVNGIDNTEEGMVWLKNRTDAISHMIMDTIRGGTNYLLANTNGPAGTDANYHINTFNNNGFTLQNGGSGSNQNTKEFSSWNFKSTPGFFDIVTWTGDGTNNRSISHSLGSVPGMIICKVRTATDNWLVWHKDLTGANLLSLDTDGAESGQAGLGNSPTSTTFTVDSNDKGNGNGLTYVAYLFAGGASTAATARSVEFDGTGDYLTLAADSDLDFGSGNFTIECWFNVTSNSTHQSFIADFASSNYQVEINTDGKCQFAWGANSTSYWSIVGNKKVEVNTWNHIAVVRNGNVFTQYLNGTFDGTFTSATSANTNSVTHIGRNSSDNRYVTGKISNVRIIKGTALYTSSFKPPTEPLTNITNTSLLCCNNSSITGSTVTPGTISSNGNPAASSDSPFDDPAAFTFGENGDQGVIKCGSYTGNGNATGPEVEIGWEPQLLITKRIDSSGNWHIYDSMRGIVTGYDDHVLRPNNTDAEEVNVNAYDLTTTGFKVRTSYTHWNANGGSYIFLAVRRPDGYVGKTADAGTNVFAMDTGNSSATIPAMDSNFPVDFALVKQPASAVDWWVYTRKTQGRYLVANAQNQEGVSSAGMFDSNVGFYQGSSYNSNYQSWMWKRHAGMDVIVYTGNAQTGRALPHNLGRTPEMWWVQARDFNNQNWRVYHKDLNGGTNPEQYYLGLDQPSSEGDAAQFWNDQAPTSTHIHLGYSAEANHANSSYTMLAFASVDGISKVGSYTGTDSNPGPTITTGFQPRFIMIKARNQSGNWLVLDTLRGISNSGNDHYAWLNLTSVQENTIDVVDISSTGFTLKAAYSDSNVYQYIYYAHA